jgi:predicted RNA-binding protein YlxR (DUF448 family)
MAEEADIPVDAVPGETAPDEQGPMRHCAETRVRRHKNELLRFVAGPDGIIVPDLTERLPGRGVWITCDRAIVAAAVRSKAFSRSLKRKVVAAEDLPSRVEMLMLQRAGHALSIANKAGLVTTGFAKVEAAISAGMVIALIHAADASEDGQQKLERRFRAVCRDANRPAIVVKVLTVEQLSLALGRLNVVHAGLGSGGAARLFLSEIERIERYSGTATHETNAGRDAARARDTGLGSR